MLEVEINENEHFTVDRDAGLYKCNFCSKTIKTPMATALLGSGSIWYHIKHAHPNFITKIQRNRYVSRRRSE